MLNEDETGFLLVDNGPIVKEPMVMTKLSHVERRRIQPEYRIGICW